MPRLKFDAQALYEAIDAQRRERGMTWNELANELRVSTSTIKGMTKRQWGIELDGVMGMTRWLGVHSALAICRWLNRTILSFTHETLV